MQSVDDLAVDVPAAVDLIAHFVARAVTDDILPPAFLQKLSEGASCSLTVPLTAAALCCILQAPSPDCIAEYTDMAWGMAGKGADQDCEPEVIWDSITE